MKSLIILGASGSIGTQTLDVCRKNPTLFTVSAVSVGRDLDLARKIILEFKPRLVCTRSEEAMNILKNEFKNISFVYGDSGLIETATFERDKNHVLVQALVGSSGLKPTYAALENGRNVCLANKETLVTAGTIIMDMARKNNCYIYPIDSEHSAIWQSLDHELKDDIKSLIITASGGSFRDLRREELINVTKEMALNHPNWSMGSKITIDSATMVNKGFEVIEASHLFQIPVSKIKTVLHRQSIIHSLVEYNDGAIKAELATSDMRIPIMYALSYPKRLEYDNKLDLIGLNLTFEELSYERYPMLKVAYDVAEKGNIFPTVFNAANEAAVSLFLNGKIKFLDIEAIILEYVNKAEYVSDFSIDKIIEVDKNIKEEIIIRFGGEN